MTLAQAALSRGDPNDPRLTKEDNVLAAAFVEEEIPLTARNK
jgi:hypothetical protein